MFAAIESGTRPVIVPAGEGISHQVFGDVIRFVLSGDDTGGALTIAFADVQPGSGPPLHLHLNEDEIFVVLDGRMSFYADGDWVEGGPGTVAYLPRALPHTFRNNGSVPARQLVITTPSGFEHFYARWAEACRHGPDLARMTAAAMAHGMELVTD